MQLVRVILVPPDVYEPAEHTEQLSASFSLHMLSAPQSSHLLWSARECVPARHGEHADAPTSADMPATHAVCTLEPSHECPAGHGEHVVRVALSPPDVYEPGGHVLQLLAPPPLYCLSSLHAEHALEPIAA